MIMQRPEPGPMSRPDMMHFLLLCALVLNYRTLFSPALLHPFCLAPPCPAPPCAATPAMLLLQEDQELFQLRPFTEASAGAKAMAASGEGEAEGH